MSAAAIVLSSSPPRAFARSPTPAEPSSSLPSPSDLFNFGSQTQNHFRPVKTAREGFGNEFTSPRSLLGVKKGAENVPFRSPGREKFKYRDAPLSQRSPRFILEKTTKEPSNGRLNAVAPKLSVKTKEQTAEDASKLDGPLEDDDRPHESAVPRRTDWTPKDRRESEADVSKSPTLQRGASFADGFLRSFSYEDQPDVSDVRSNKVRMKETVNKKQRVELVAGVPAQSASRTKKAKSNATEKTTTTKRKSCPAKKPMTITALATDAYREQGQLQKDSPIVQYLSATQARTRDDSDGESRPGENIQVQVTKPKSRKPAAQKAKLMSPQSAMKAVNAQATVFGSASQLARDDSAVLKPHADPFSTQQTQPISIESTTPQSGRGTSRFARVKDLWNVSARDEDNALLHVDTVDMFDTPALRNAFAGKDTLFQECLTRGATGSMKGAASTGAIVDVDDFESPLIRTRPVNMGAAVVRSFHTSANTGSPRKAATRSPDVDQQPEPEMTETQQATKAKAKAKKAAPKKPSYAGFSTSDLQKQISAFGFKPVKKREKMVELLEMCWEQKHGKPDDRATDETNLKHGDFLDKVHDVANRPQPKVPKTKKRTKDEQSDKSPKKTTKRQKKAAPVADGPDPPKRGRPRKSKIAVPAAGDVVDIDDTETAVGTTVAPSKQMRKSSACNLTPPPSRPVVTTEDIQSNVSTVEAETATSLATPPLSEEKAIGEQIYAAIMKQSQIEKDTDRNHKQNPTWHEKILLFDPIILEDLTVWLNTEGLGLVGEDREVSTIEVRDWLEAKSICCLWRGGWRGNKKTGTDD